MTATADRIMAARQIAANRASEAGPRIELYVVSGCRRAVINVSVRLADLATGAREAIEAGLRSLWSADDASRLVVTTGRSRGEARRAENEGLAARGEAWLRAYGHSDGLDDATPETMHVLHHAAWAAERETPEAYLSRCLGCYAGRIVSAGAQ